MDVKREKNRLVWKKLDMKTGTNHLAVNGWWELEGEKSHSDFHAKLDGKNNSDVMVSVRFNLHTSVSSSAAVVLRIFRKNMSFNELRQSSDKTKL